jgi:Mitotic-spindle organizing gamma-tubulin ring associated
MKATEEEETRIMALMQAISIRLDTGLPPPALQAILDLLRQGVHPDAVVAVIETLLAS